MCKFKVYNKHRQYTKKQRHHSADNGPYNQSYGFSSSHVQMWELDQKEDWAPNNWCFWTVVLEKTFESPLDSKEIHPVHPRGNQSWIFIGRTDAEAEVPILWPPDVKSWFIGKDPDIRKDWRQEEKEMTEGEMARWHHWFSGHEFEQGLRDGDGQGSLVCCSPWGCRELDTTERLNNRQQQGVHVLIWCTSLFQTEVTRYFQPLFGQLFRNRIIEWIIKLWSLEDTQYDWCPYKKGKYGCGDRPTPTENTSWNKGRYWDGTGNAKECQQTTPSKESIVEQILPQNAQTEPPSWHLDHRLLASRTEAIDLCGLSHPDCGTADTWTTQVWTAWDPLYVDLFEEQIQ